MSIRIYSRQDIDPSLLAGKTITVIGYGNQGQAHALNLRDSGCHVVVGQRESGKGYTRAVDDGFTPLPIAEATAKADLLILALPDEAAPAVYCDEIAPHLGPGSALGFVHGFNIHYCRIVPPKNVDVILVAPKGAGYMVREAFVAGGGLPCLVGVHQNATGQALGLALAWAAGLGGDRAALIESTFAAETETDLFGEQAAVVGGVVALMKTAFKTLVREGYDPLHAYLECVYEVKFVVDLIHREGINGMRQRISPTAFYGELTAGPALTQALEPVMKQLLADIHSGQFAERWLEQARSGKPALADALKQDADNPLEQARHIFSI